MPQKINKTYGGSITPPATPTSTPPPLDSEPAHDSDEDAGFAMSKRKKKYLDEQRNKAMEEVEGIPEDE